MLYEILLPRQLRTSPGRLAVTYSPMRASFILPLLIGTITCRSHTKLKLMITERGKQVHNRNGSEAREININRYKFVVHSSE